jgi:hypothetical protein
MITLALIMALIQVESSGRDCVTGDGGRAIGCLQLHAAYVADAAQYAGEEWTHTDAYDRQKSIEIFSAYMARYATQQRLGREVTAQDIARIHNGGPNGHKRASTVKYWDKVKKEL